jgi:hypothetical protein
LDAVGTGFPGIPRQDLMVLPEPEWQKNKDQLLYDAWAAKTKLVEQQDMKTVKTANSSKSN